jgi:hypothetical protein
MSDRSSDASQDLIDRIALQIQQLRSSKKIRDGQPLLRIDNRKEAAQAPFQFDVVESVLHRTSCSAIPKRSRSALYALWEVQSQDIKYACPECKPLQQQSAVEASNTSDVFYGFLSILDQFSTVLSERGSEYRSSEKGRQTEATIDRILHELDVQQKQSVAFLFGSLDEVIRIFRGLNGDGAEHARLPTNGEAPLRHIKRTNGLGAKTTHHKSQKVRHHKRQ